MKIDISSVDDPEAKRFLQQFLRDRAINREFYERVPEDELDFRMVDTPSRKSDSPRESIAHQIDTERDYINGVKSGVLKFGVKYDDLFDLQSLTKNQLLDMLQHEDEELITLLSDPTISEKMVKPPWSENPIPAVSCLWALDSHEILHTGWNLALMDHLDIERFQVLKDMWG